MEEGDRSFEDLISDLEEKRLSMEEDRETIRREKQAIEDLKKQTAEAGDAVSRKKDDIRRLILAALRCGSLMRSSAMELKRKKQTRLSETSINMATDILIWPNSKRRGWL